MPINLQKNSDQEIKELLKKNLELNKELYKMIKSIKSYIVAQKIWFIVKMSIIIIFFVVGAIYVPPIFEDVFVQYRELLGLGNSLNESVNNINIDSLPPNLLKLLK